MSSIRKAVKEYAELGFDTLPLKPGMKDPLMNEWQRRESYRMWRVAPENANVGIRCGGDLRIAVWDCDEMRAYENTQNLMFALGYDPGSYPIVSTPKRKLCHVYTTFLDDIPGNYRNFTDDFGLGEFRYGHGAYTAAPPSVITDGGVYSLIDGDFRQLPKLTLSDVLPILRNQDTTLEPEKPKIPRKAVALLHGKYIENYASRSEAEQALIVSLVNSGHEFDRIASLFSSYPTAGKFKELYEKNPRNAMRWLRLSYDNAIEWAQTHESKARQIAQNNIAWANSRPWPGRTGSVDRAVYLAHANTAHKSGRIAYAASSRDLAELAGCTFATASRATHRLRSMELLHLVTPAVADCANIYELRTNLHTPSPRFVRKCVSLSNLDVFRWHGLGKSAAEMWEVLQEGPANIDELSMRTGRHVRTVKRALDRMTGLVDSITGEIIDMVEGDGKNWRALDVNLDYVAQLIGTAGYGKLQWEKHSKERRLHRWALTRGQVNGKAKDDQTN